jgi:hypothetical protein
MKLRRRSKLTPEKEQPRERTTTKPPSPPPAPKTPAGVMPGAEHAPFATLAPQVCFPTSYDTDDDDTVDNKPIFNVPDIESPTFKQSRTRRPCRNRLIRHARLKSPLR